MINELINWTRGLAALQAKYEKRDAIGRRYQRMAAAKTRRLEFEFAATFVRGKQWYQAEVSTSRRA
jgi:hypothetical protein